MKKRAGLAISAFLIVILTNAAAHWWPGYFRSFTADAMEVQGLSAADEIARKAETLRSKLIAQRRDFHMHPELSNREERTSKVIAERLRALGFDEVRTGVGKYGVVGILKGKQPGPVVAVRADMDALPILETLDVPYKSQNAGVKHACGHDVHMTVQLGVAEVLSGMREKIHGPVKFIFQPAEEGPPANEDGVAGLMIIEGALENPRPAAIFGLHVMPNIEVGQVGYNTRTRVLYSGRVVVTPDETDVVMVTRGVETHRIECTPLCRPRPDIGDGESASAINDQLNNRAAAATASRR